LAGNNNNQVASYYLSLPLGSVQSEVLTTALNVYDARPLSTHRTQA
jgi:hypothetical protein